MLGAIVGDVIGSVFEFDNRRTRDFSLFEPRRFFTDDTVMTVACADAILAGTDFGESYMAYGRAYPDAGFGGMFARWLRRGVNRPYWSYGNGSAMRAGPCGWAATSLQEARELGERSAAATHDHPEGMKGARAVAAAVFLARTGAARAEIMGAMTEEGYRVDLDLDDLRRTYDFDESCQGTLPQALSVVFASDGFEDAIRTPCRSEGTPTRSRASSGRSPSRSLAACRRRSANRLARCWTSV